MNSSWSDSQYRAEVDQHRCVGTGDCVRIAPTGFALDPIDGRSRALPSVGDTPVDDLLDAASNCPTQAIRVFGEHDDALV